MPGSHKSDGDAGGGCERLRGAATAGAKKSVLTDRVGGRFTGTAAAAVDGAGGPADRSSAGETARSKVDGRKPNEDVAAANSANSDGESSPSGSAAAAARDSAVLVSRNGVCGIGSVCGAAGAIGEGNPPAGRGSANIMSSRVPHEGAGAAGVETEEDGRSGQASRRPRCLGSSKGSAATGECVVSAPGSRRRWSSAVDVRGETESRVSVVEEGECASEIDCAP